ncbi:525_t:CDS:2, partial [Cetraspora pellucida]
KKGSMNSQSTQTEFQYIDGRRFHNVKGSMYILSNDENEQDRLHLQHFLIRYVWQSNFSAPVEHILVKPGVKILDIGYIYEANVLLKILRLTSHPLLVQFRCGAGSWSFDMATTYPLIDVVGLDISPHQPTHIKPSNFTFIRVNVLESIPFEDNTFDFVFQRFMSGAFTEENWSYAISEISRVLKPGGFLELMEPSRLYDIGPITQRLWEAQITFRKQRGLDTNMPETLEKYLQNQDQLENIKKEVKQIRHGAKFNDIQLDKLGINNLISLMAGLKSFTTKILKVSDDEYDELLKASEKELSETEFYYYMVRVYANKATPNNN